MLYGESINTVKTIEFVLTEQICTLYVHTKISQQHFKVHPKLGTFIGTAALDRLVQLMRTFAVRLINGVGWTWIMGGGGGGIFCRVSNSLSIIHSLTCRILDLVIVFVHQTAGQYLASA